MKLAIIFTIFVAGATATPGIFDALLAPIKVVTGVATGVVTGVTNLAANIVDKVVLGTAGNILDAAGKVLVNLELPMATLVTDIVSDFPTGASDAVAFKAQFIDNLKTMIPNVVTQLFAFFDSLSKLPQALTQDELAKVMNQISTNILADIQKAVTAQ